MITAVAVLFVFFDLLQGILQALCDGKLSRPKTATDERKRAAKAGRSNLVTHFEEHPEDKFRQDYPGYGYNGMLESVLQDFNHLPASETYLDHAGATLCSLPQIHAHAEMMASSTFGNPHSRSPSSQRTTKMLQEARAAVLEHFNAHESEYAVVFTSGATQAIKIVAENFKWTPGHSTLAYSRNNHNSILGMRTIAEQANAPFLSLPRSSLAALSSPPSQLNRTGDPEPQGGMAGSDEDAGSSLPCHLFAFPAECNFGGGKEDLGIIPRVKTFGLAGAARVEAGRWFVLLDAAKHAATSPLDLSVHRPDFLCLSFYKMFGLPTGLGALLLRREAAEACLEKKFFSGGTVLAARADEAVHVLREDLSQRFEDGTVSFLSIMAVKEGLGRLRKLGMRDIKLHTWSLRDYLASSLLSMRHRNGAPLVELYGPRPGTGPERAGSICSFNLKAPDGSYIRYSEVETLAALEGINVRTGAFCNPGATQEHLGLTTKDLDTFLQDGKVCGDDKCVINGSPTGAIRVSVGYMSTFADVGCFLHFVWKHFGAGSHQILSPTPLTNTSTITDSRGCERSCNGPADAVPSTGEIELSELWIYPIKSCAGQLVQSWPLGPAGLLYDREFAVIDSQGTALSQKMEPSLNQIRCHVDLDGERMLVEAAHKPSMPPLTIPLRQDCPESAPEAWAEAECGLRKGGGEGGGGGADASGGDTTFVRVCGSRQMGLVYGGEARRWFSEALGRQCTLVRKNRPAAGPAGKNFYNEGQLLAISHESLQGLRHRLEEAKKNKKGNGPGEGRSRRGEKSGMLEGLWGRCGWGGRGKGEQKKEVGTWEGRELGEGLKLRMRPNLVIRWTGEGEAAEHWEDDLAEVRSDGVRAGDAGCAFGMVKKQSCYRCIMVNVDPFNASVSSEPLLTLSAYRRDPDVGRVKFGVLLDLATTSLPSTEGSSTISTPCRLRVTMAPPASTGKARLD